MKKVTVSAPGKLHLSGEHAVVHGKPAVLVSTSKRLYVTVEMPESAEEKNSLRTLRRTDQFIEAICKVFEERYATNIPKGVGITIASDIPKGAGMGSSAALAVSLIGALVTMLDKPWDPQRINEVAYQAEKYIHMNASGSDPAIVTHGGILWYRKEMDFLKTFWLLPFKVPKIFASFVLINTGRVEKTGDLVVQVEALKKSDMDAFTLVLSEIEKVTKSMIQAIHDEKEQEFRGAIAANERLLEQIGVVSTSTQVFIRAIEKAGGVAKISGAGGVKQGSGVVIAIHDSPKILIELARAHGHTSFQVVLGGEGVRKEHIIV